MPFVTPVIVNGVVVDDAGSHAPPLSWYWYDVTGASPSVPAPKSSDRNESPDVSEFRVGAPGRSSGVTATTGVDAVPEPAAFCALTET